MPTRKKTPWPAEWWHGEGMFYTRAEVDAAEKRANKTIEAKTDEPVVHITEERKKRGRPSSGTRPCKTCGTVFPTDAPQLVTRCPSCRDGRQETRTCEGCGELYRIEVRAGNRQSKYCSPRCSQRVHSQRYYAKKKGRAA